MRMQTANRSSQDMAGCLEMLEIDVDGIKTWAHAYVIADAPYHLLLGRLWQWLIRLSKSETVDMVYVTIHDPTDIMQVQTCATLPHPPPSLASAMLSAAAFSNLLSAKNSPPAVMHITASPLAECLLQESFDFDPV